MSEYYKEARDVLESLLEDIGVKKSERERKIEEHWAEIAGARISTYSSFARTEKKTLIITTEENAYLPLILAQKKRIIDKYNKFFPEDRIRYLRVIVSSRL